MRNCFDKSKRSNFPNKAELYIPDYKYGLVSSTDHMSIQEVRDWLHALKIPKDEILKSNQIYIKLFPAYNLEKKKKVHENMPTYCKLRSFYTTNRTSQKLLHISETANRRLF